MISFPTSYDDVTVDDDAIVRSGGTDLQERLRTEASRNPDAAHVSIIDLTGIEGFAGITVGSEGTRIGGGTPMATVARELAASYPMLAMTTGGLATPQIRAQGTVAGNLTQHTRCWYYRHPGFDCFKSGGDSCPARDGRHLYGVVFDTSECVHPHPSSIAMALLCHDATVELASGGELTISEMLGDGVDPTCDNALPRGEIITAVHIDRPWDNEHGAYFRSISRFEAEWPLVECAVRASVDGDTISNAALALGGVATVPMLMTGPGQRLVGSTLDDATIAAVAAACADGATPLAETGYKVDLVVATVQETLERLRSSLQKG